LCTSLSWHWSLYLLYFLDANWKTRSPIFYFPSESIEYGGRETSSNYWRNSTFLEISRLNNTFYVHSFTKFNYEFDSGFRFFEAYPFFRGVGLSVRPSLQRWVADLSCLLHDHVVCKLIYHVGQHAVLISFCCCECATYIFIRVNIHLVFSVNTKLVRVHILNSECVLSNFQSERGRFADV